MKLIVIAIVLSLFSCMRYPFYSRMTRGDWKNRTEYIAFSDVPNQVKDTLSKLYDKFNNEKDYFLPAFISLDSNYSFKYIGYYTMDSKKLIIPFGEYFKLNDQKLFIDYSELKSCYIYFDSCFYYPSDKFSVKKNRVTKSDYSDYQNRFIVKYRLKDQWLK